MSEEGCLEILKEFGNELFDDISTLQKEVNSTLNLTFGRGPDLYFYRKVVSQTKNVSHEDVKELLENKQFVELLYATLAAWNMNSRGARIKSFKEFSQNIRTNISRFVELCKASERYISENRKDYNSLLELSMNLFVSLDIMEYRGKKPQREARKLVANSKLMHFVFPEVIMPIDRTYTVKFFREFEKGKCGRLKEYPKPKGWEKLDEDNKSDARTFFKIHKAVFEWIKDKTVRDNLQKLIDNRWNQTIPKVIDNLIVYYVKTRL